MNKSSFRVIGWLALLGLILLALRQVSAMLPLFDYIEYWTAGYLNLRGSNPYGLQELDALQRQLGWTSPDALIAWNPPWTLSLMMMFSLLPYPLSRAGWLLISMFCVLWAAEQTWRLYHGQPKKKRLALLAGITFAPVFFNLLLGQITPLILLGVVGFLSNARQAPQDWRKGLVAGACLSLAAIKPQILYLAPLALLFWSLSRRNWTLLAGFALALMAASLASLAFNPQAFAQYLTALANYPPSHWATPTAGYYLRIWFGWDQFWLQFLPSLAGIIWLSFYWLKNQKTWDWQRHLPLLLLVSLITSSYTWVHDQVVLVPVIVLFAMWVSRQTRSRLAILALILYSSANLVYLVLHFKLDDSVFAWFAPWLLLLYLPVHRWLMRNPSSI